MAGVSVSTVSNAINGKKNVGKQTREKILKLCEEYGYAGHAAEDKEGISDIRTILFNFSDFDRSFYLEVINGVNTYVREHGYDLMICTKVSCEKFMKSGLTCGCIILDMAMKNQLLLDVADRDYPIVTLDRYLEHPYITLEFDSELDDVQTVEYSFISGMDENGFVSQTQNTCPYIIEDKILKIDADKIKIYGLGTYHLFFSNLSISYGGLNQNVEVFDDYTFVVTNEVTAFANFKTAENNSVTFECITTIEDLRLVSMNLKLYDSDGNALLGGKDKAYSLEYKGQHKIGNGLYSQIYSISYLPDLTKSLKFVSVTADSEKVKEEDPENYFGIYINNVSSENQVNGRYEIETED